MIYEKIIRPLLFQFDPEAIHHFSANAMANSPLFSLVRLFENDFYVEQPLTLWNLTFRNRIGLAAGFDKNAQLIDPIYDLGFGFTEVGTITRHPQPGNLKPRVFRCPQEKGLINRLGFPNEGTDHLKLRIQEAQQSKRRKKFPIGINIGKSKITPLEKAPEDYLYSFQSLYSCGDFFVVNVSSPNTPGLRELQQTSHLKEILSPLQSWNQAQANKPLLLKIAPDLTEKQISEILQLIEDLKIHGIVATNTTIDHSAVSLQETGGLSGKPLRKKSTEIIRFISKETEGKLPIIGVGGIFDSSDVEEKIEAGATLLQVYTGFIYQGPLIVPKLLRP